MSPASRLRPALSSRSTRAAIHLARKTREGLGLGLGTPVGDLLGLVERAGVGVAVLDLGAGVAGSLCRPNGLAIAFVNGRDPTHRERFTLAHEFGHHVLGHAARVDDRATVAGHTSDRKEAQANAFAAEFLMPAPAAQAWAEERLDEPVTLDTVVRFAGDFGVSATAACIRLQTAGVLTDERLCRRLHEEIAAGEHFDLRDRLGVGEPDDGLAQARLRLPRLPEQLRRSALGELLAGALEVEAFAKRIGRDPQEVRAALAALGLDRLVAASA